MTIGQKLFRVNNFLPSFSIPENTKTPAITGAFAIPLIMDLRYSFKELGSELFLGDFRLR